MKILKTLRQVLEACIVIPFYLLGHILPLRPTANAISWLTRRLGKLLGVNRMMKRNIAGSFPDLSEKEVASIADGAWGNLGRVIVEYCHLEKFKAGKDSPRLEIEGLEHLEALKNDGKPGVIFSAHYGNWQMMTMVARSIGLEMGQIFRPASNRWVNWTMEDSQRKAVDHIFRRNKQGTRALAHFLQKDKGHIMMLIDQNFFDGPIIPFLGRPAYAAPGIARMARRFDCVILPSRAVRVNDSHFKVVFYPPLVYDHTGNIEEDDRNFIIKANTMIESWICEHPEQWMWQHNRWKVRS